MSMEPAKKRVKIGATRGGEKLCILDAGAQYGKVIDRRVRELSVECDLLPLDTPAAELGEYAAVIVSGGPQSVYDADAPKYDPSIFALGVPLLGICYGMQLLNYAGGGSVERKSRREDGQFPISLVEGCPLFEGLGDTSEVLLTHGDSVDKVPEGFRVIARSGELVAGIECAEKRQYGVQFHPEVDLSVDGVAMLRNFLYGVCGFTGVYSKACREQLAIDYIRETVGPSKKVLCLVSGGVDSSVCAALLHKAIGADRLICLHVDHGFMRHEESATVVEALRALGVPIEVLDARPSMYTPCTCAPPCIPSRGRHAHGTCAGAQRGEDLRRGDDEDRRAADEAAGRDRLARGEAQDHRRHLHGRHAGHVRGQGAQGRRRLPRAGQTTTPLRAARRAPTRALPRALPRAPAVARALAAAPARPTAPDGASCSPARRARCAPT